jgi:hypothetical protein
MNLPFTTDQFLDVFGQYNQAIWPMQIFLHLFAFIAIFLALKKFKNSDKIVSSILAFFWMWIGIVYHLLYFTAINKAAYFFGILFIIQGFMFLYTGDMKSRLSFKYHTNLYSVFGGIFILYSLIIYPILGHQLGHIYPRTPTFGLPCPTTIFTFGLLLWTDKNIPKYVIIIPLLWSIIGFGAALGLTIYQDYGLLIAGALGTILIIFRDKKID